MTQAQQVSFIGRAIRIAGCWLAFWFGCWIAPFIVLGFHFSSNEGYAKRVGRAADKMCAALLGKSGRYTLSSECAFAEDKRLRQLHDILNDIKTGHCESEVLDENMYCRLSDHRLGEK